MDRHSYPRYSFGDFTLDLDRGCLLRDGQEVKLRPKSFEVLKYLVERRGRLVSKSDLMLAVWPDAFVTDDSLVQCLVEVRRALGDDSQCLVKTVPRRGYIFEAVLSNGSSAAGNGVTPERIVSTNYQIEEVKAKVNSIQEESVGLNYLSSGDSHFIRRLKLDRKIITIGFLSVALAVALSYSWPNRMPEQPIKGMPRTIAVLPFKPLVANNRDEAFELGMADNLITRLSGLKELIVRPTSAIRKYTALDQDPLAAGREQGVEAVLEASLHREGSKIRVNVRLLDTSDGSALWSYQSEDYFTDIFTAQDTISAKIVGALALELTGGERSRLAKRYTENTEAYQAYVKGRFFLEKRSEDGFKKAIEYFQQAIGKDSQYALAYAGLADCYNLFGGYGLLPPKETYPRGKAAAIKALEFDEHLAEAYTALAVAKARYDWDAAGAEKNFKRAIELNPGYALAHQWYAVFSLIVAERYDEALVEVKLAQQIDPLSLATGLNVGIVNFYARRFDEAIEQLEKTLELDGRFVQTYEFLGRALEEKGKYEEAITTLEKALDLSPENTNLLAPLGRAYAVSDKRDEAQKILDRLKNLSGHRYVMPYHIAAIYAAQSDKDQAFEWLQKAYEKRDDRLIFLKADAAWDSLRADPRFAALIIKN